MLIIFGWQSAARWAAWAASGLTASCPRSFGETFPWGTMLINVTGSFVIGFFAALTGTGRPAGSRRAPLSHIFHDRHLRRLHDVFLVQPANLESRCNDGEWLYAGGNVILFSVVLCLAGRLAGLSPRRADSTSIKGN